MAVGQTLPKTQRAAQYDPKDNALHINTIPVPSINSNQLLVKVKSASLCASDLMALEGTALLAGNEPVTTGHEAIGEIVEVGDGSKGFKLGDVIGFFCVVDCCYECEGCQVHLLYCEQGTSKVQGMGLDGFFQEYVVVDYRNAVHIPAGMDLNVIAPLCCAGVTSFNAVRSCELQPGDWLAVIGCGGLGHLGIQYAKAMELRVIGIDVSQEALQEAKAQGADYMFNPAVDKDYVQEIKKVTGKGCHAAVNFTNSSVAYASQGDVLRTNGIFMVVGIPVQPLTFQGIDVSLRRFRVKGSNNGNAKILKECIDFSHKHGVLPHVEYYKLDQINKMVSKMQKGVQRGRMVIRFD